MRPPERSLSKWHKLAYELEADAARMRRAGHERLASSLKLASSILGDAVRNVE